MGAPKIINVRGPRKTLNAALGQIEGKESAGQFPETATTPSHPKEVKFISIPWICSPKGLESYSCTSLAISTSRKFIEQITALKIWLRTDKLRDI